jgi:hypothetical protein
VPALNLFMIRLSHAALTQPGLKERNESMLSSKSGVTDGSRSEDRRQARLIMMKDACFNAEHRASRRPRRAPPRSLRSMITKTWSSSLCTQVIMDSSMAAEPPR